MRIFHWSDRPPPFFLLIVLCSVLILQSCDGLVSENQVETDAPKDTPAHALEAEKFRNAELLDRAITTEGGQKNGKAVLNLIFSVHPNKVLDRFKVLDRYKILDRYKVLDRFEFLNAFPGFAISVEDESGTNDFTPFVNELMKDPDIAWFEPDFSVHLPEGNGSIQQQGQIVPWSVTAVGGEQSWAVSGNGQGKIHNVEVFVLDTGVSNGLSNANDDLVIGDVLDFRDLAHQDPKDYDGHGTHIAGIIGAYDNAMGVAGVAPGVTIHNYKVLNDNGGTDVSVAIAAVEHILSKKLANPSTPMVVNLSLGEDIGSTSFTALDLTIQQGIEAGITFVVAAGNHGGPVEHITPAHVPEVITVGAYDVDNRFSTFSAYGPLVDILAPGEDIISLSPPINGAPGAPVAMTGTSMATAHVTGAVALFLAQNKHATPEQVSDALLANSRSTITGTPSGTTNRSLWVGLGAEHAAVQAGLVYSIQNMESGWCLDINNASQSNGGNAMQYECHWGANQLWKLGEANSDDHYTFEAMHSGMWLDASHHQSPNVYQWTQHGKSNQQWRLDDVGDGYVTIKSRHYGTCLETETSDHLGNARLGSCTGANNQKWRLVAKDWMAASGDRTDD